MLLHAVADVRWRTFTSFLAMAIAAALVSCGDSDSDSPTAVETGDSSGEIMVVDESGATSVDLHRLSDAVGEMPVGSLSTEERAALRFMREEEKLAHDVYMALYERWGLSIFENIARSEQSHTDAVGTLIERYGLEDPSAERESGQFESEDLQTLHDTLVAMGEESLSEALRVGAAIEEIDILDLEERIAQTNQEDIILVYENLMKGSRNHLRSFVSTLKEQTGEEYEPQYLTREAYDAIVDTSVERGGNSESGGNSGNGGRG